MDAEQTEAVIARLHGIDEPELRSINLGLLGHAPLFDIEVASACNVVCTFCPRDEMVRRNRLMDADTFRATLNFLPASGLAMLSGLGDALLHPQLADFARRLVAHGISPCIITNGVRLTPARQDELIVAGIAEIQVSVHGLDETAVRRVMPVGADPSTVRAHVERLAAVGGTRIRINFVETAHNSCERAAVEAWAVDLGARFFYRRQHTRGGTIGSARPKAGCTGCGIFGSVTFISADGDVLPCVNDVRGEGRLGNVREITWDAVLAWKRQVIEGGEWFAACRQCDDDYRWVLLAKGGMAGA